MLIWKHYAFSNASLILNVHYQLALTYEPVHLSLYVAEQGTRFLWTQSQTSLQCYPQPAARKRHINRQRLARCFIVLTWSEQTRKWHVTLEPISFILCLYVRSLPLLALVLVLRIYKGGRYIFFFKKVPTATMQHWANIDALWIQQKDVAGESMTHTVEISVTGL